MCEEYCGAAKACGDAKQCLTFCAEPGVPSECLDELDALLVCLIPVIADNCEAVGVCVAESESFGQCIEQPACFSQGCLASDTDCSCTGECNGLPVESACVDGGLAKCSCFIEGTFVGECDQDFLSCEVENSCCKTFFF